MGVDDTADEITLSKPGWRYYLQQKVLVIFFLGFSAGLPFPLVYSTLSAWLSDAGLNKSTISTFAWLGFAYSFKFVWAPLVDSSRIPILTGILGRRRAWLLSAQLGILVALFVMSNVDPVNSLQLFTYVAIAVAFLSATQDIVLDAYRIEIGDERMQGPLAASYQYGYRMAMFVGGAVALLIADLGSWSVAYKAMAVAMGIGLITTLLSKEPSERLMPASVKTAGQRDRFVDWFSKSVAGPFVDFFRRYGRFGLIVLLFIATFRLSDVVLGILANPFYLDIGLTKSEIALVSKTYGIWVSFLGIAVAAWAIVKYGPSRCIVPAAILYATTNLAFLVMAYAGPDLWVFAGVITADNFAQGFAGSVGIAYLSSLTSLSFTATQYALFSSIGSFFGKLMAGYSGNVQEAIGWAGFFLYVAVIGIPAIILSVIISRHDSALKKPA